MTLTINNGLTNAALYDAAGAYVLPLGSSAWVLTPPAGVTVGLTSTAVWATDDVRCEATIGQTSGGALVVTNGSYPDSATVVGLGFGAFVVAWLTCALTIKSMRGAATQTIPDL
jgi:hypothetical protein